MGEGRLVVTVLFIGLALLRDMGASEAEVLSAELQRLGVRSALVLQSQALDEEPVWAPDGGAIAVNIEGSWKRLDLSHIVLMKAEWHGGVPLGFLQSPSLTPLKESDLARWKAGGRRDPRKITTRAGTAVEMKSVDLGTAFVISPKGKAPEVLWKTSMENCHSLSLSPDERLVAFICELNGLVVTKL